MGCNEALGTIVKLYGTFLPSFAARSITFDDDDGIGRAHKEKKWDALARDKFNIEPITDNDLVSCFKRYLEQQDSALRNFIHMFAF